MEHGNLHCTFVVQKSNEILIKSFEKKKLSHENLFNYLKHVFKFVFHQFKKYFEPNFFKMNL